MNEACHDTSAFVSVDLRYVFFFTIDFLFFIVKSVFFY